MLYIHGFSDYFFQRHMAERFAAEGYAFYALDLRKYGRSLRPGQHGNFCKSLSEYYPDIARAIDVIGEPVLLAGHSTGGLVCALYMHEGAGREIGAAFPIAQRQLRDHCQQQACEPYLPQLD